MKTPFSFPMNDEIDMTIYTLKQTPDKIFLKHRHLRQNFAIKNSFYFSQIFSFHIFLQ
jgi:hypothetical protein